MSISVYELLQSKVYKLVTHVLRHFDAVLHEWPLKVIFIDEASVKVSQRAQVVCKAKVHFDASPADLSANWLC